MAGATIKCPKCGSTEWYLVVSGGQGQEWELSLKRDPATGEFREIVGALASISADERFVCGHEHEASKKTARLLEAERDD